MTSPTPRPGTAAPGADTTKGAPPPHDQAAATVPSSGPYGPLPGAYGEAAEAAEKTVTDVILEPDDEQPTGILARLTEDAPSAETTSPPLTPDAILPPGMVPEPPPPEPEPETDGTRPTPRLESGMPPGGPGGPRQGFSPRGGAAGARKTLLIGGGALAALLLGGGGVVAYTTTSSDTPQRHRVAAPPHSAPPTPPPSTPAPTPTPSKAKAKHRPKHKPVPVDIRDEKKDPRPLTVREVFPHDGLTVTGRPFAVAKTVLNGHCEFTANKPFSTALVQQHCRVVVRATFVSQDKKIVVTAGIAAMPTDAAAKSALKAQDPDHYKWFRGMTAPRAPKIDQPGGIAASARRGRYICYAYVAWGDGHKARPDDKTLKAVAGGFRDAMVAPIDKRAKSKV